MALVAVLASSGCGSAGAGSSPSRSTVCPSTSVASGSLPPGVTATTETCVVTPTVLSYPPHVALFGDSLSSEAEPYYFSLVRSTGRTAIDVYASYGGSAICDWLTKMRSVAATYRLNAVELQFSGNALSACMGGLQPPDPGYYDKYQADAATAVGIFVARGVRVYLVGAPITRAQQQGDPGWQALNQIYLQLAAADPAHVTFVDAGTAVELPGHTYTDTLPCLVVEPCTGRVVDGVRSNVVRSPDGVHFCPVARRGTSCPVYSSGAYRYAAAMAGALAVPVSAAPGVVP